MKRHKALGTVPPYAPGPRARPPLGTGGGSEVGVIAVAKLREANEAFFKDWMEA